MYVLLCFSEHNDIADIKDYVRWKADGQGYGNYNLNGKNFLQRYAMALRDVLYAPLAEVIEGEQRPAGDLITIKVGNSTVKTVISYKNETRPPDELLKLNEWKVLRELLGQFRTVAAENNIVPVVLFFPTKAHIYAEYSISESDPNWMKIRDEQIAAKHNVEATLGTLCQEKGIELISVSPAFERAASQGKFLYYPFDTHWNSEGRQIAASVVAERLVSINSKK